ncbi:putative methyltransferase-domain-containing protein [Daedaleopsis nitida]|nr:putative methyltransferase-domain-containing protein [Daedaleopsis nitida]
MMISPPAPPTSSLPPLARLSTFSRTQIEQAVDNLRSIYRPHALTALPQPKALPKHLVHDISVPDSGYASAEGEDEDEEDCDEEDGFDIDVLRSDTFEREFAIRWLTGLTARSDMWVYAPECTEEESDARAALVDAAAGLLGTFAGEDEEEALTRTFTFPTRTRTCANATEAVHVELNDAPLLSDDHTSVGLQSWGSSIRLAERMCLDPRVFGLSDAEPPADRLRVLELGAGTGLLSIAAAKLLTGSVEVVATDYHPSVLDNLRANVSTNFPSRTARLQVLPLDWQRPVYDGPFAEQFNVILAADVIYHPDHARWIKACVQRLLARDSSDSGGAAGGVFWLIIPLRPTGRHEGMSNTVEAVFPHVLAVDCKEHPELAILEVEELRKQDGVGRADEGGYKLYRIGWA